MNWFHFASYFATEIQYSSGIPFHFPVGCTCETSSGNASDAANRTDDCFFFRGVQECFRILEDCGDHLDCDANGEPDGFPVEKVVNGSSIFCIERTAEDPRVGKLSLEFISIYFHFYCKYDVSNLLSTENNYLKNKKMN